MTNEPGSSVATPLSRRQLRELERRRALEEAGQDPDAPPDAADAEAGHGEPDGTVPPEAVAARMDGARPDSGIGENPGSYEELARELTLDRQFSRRELRALYEAREAQRVAAGDGIAAADADDVGNATATAERTEPVPESSAPKNTDTADAAPDDTETAGTEPADAEPESTAPENTDTADAESEAEHEALLLGTESASEPARAAESEAEHDALLHDTEAQPAPAADVEHPLPQPLTLSADPSSGADSDADSQPVEPVLDADTAGDLLITSPVVYGTTPEHWTGADEDFAVATSTIVLPPPSGPADPQPTPAPAGEVIVTGTIDLPPAPAARGGHPDRYDSAEIDRLIDAADGVDQFESEAAPVRAVPATLGAASAGSAVRVAPRRGVTLPVVLAGTGGVLLVGVGALLVVALGIR